MYARRLAGSGMARNLVSQSCSAWSDSAENPRSTGGSAGIARVAESRQQSKVVGRHFIGRIIARVNRPSLLDSNRMLRAAGHLLLLAALATGQVQVPLANFTGTVH